MIHNLFPTPIGRYSLDRDLTSDELLFLKNQETCSNMGNTHSINNTLLKSKKLNQLKNFIEDKVLEYFQTIYNPKQKVNLQITQSWTNYTTKDQYHHKHAHPNSFISGVFYIQANNETDRIHFFHEKYEQIKITPTEWNLWNSESWWFEVGTGDLILFPSSLSHMVQTVKTEDTRISLAFNTFPFGQLGDDKKLTGLNLS